MFGNRIKALILALFIQAGIAGLIFIGGILDPLIGVWVAGVYFFVIGFYLMYHYMLINLSKVKNKSGENY